MDCGYKRKEDNAMKVFVSWSGELSQKFAGAIKEWLEQCIQSVEVFFSSEDIEKGDNWQVKLSNELQETNYGIVCLTPENIDAPWIHFEAGALSKMLDSRVMVLAMNINYGDIKGPLKAFQATKFEHDDVFKMLKAINGAQEKPLSDEKLKNSFEAFWPQFKSKIDQIKKDSSNVFEDKKNPRVNVSGTVEEILQIVRSQNSLINNPERLLPAEYLEFVFNRMSRGQDSIGAILQEIHEFSVYIIDVYGENPVDDMDKFWMDYYKFLKHIASINPSWRRKFVPLMTRIINRLEVEDKIPDSENE